MPRHMLLWMLAAFITLPIFAEDSPVFIKFIAGKDTIVAGYLGKEGDAEIEVFDFETNKPKTYKKDQIKSVQRNISLNEVAHTIGVARIAAWEIARALPVDANHGRIVRLDDGLIYVSLGSEQGAIAGTELRVYRGEIPLIDPGSKEVLGTERRLIAKLEVTEVREKFAKAKLQGDLEIKLEVGDLVEPAAEKNALAVVPLLDESDRPVAAGKEFAEKVSGVLANQGRAVVERTLLSKALGELALQNTVLFDPASAQQVGKLVGARFVVIGRVLDKRVAHEYQIRLVEVESAKIKQTFQYKVAAQGNNAVDLAPIEGEVDAAGNKGKAGEIIGYWRFNDDLKDGSGSGLHGQEVERVAFAKGVKCSALNSSGTNYARIPHHSKLEVWDSGFTFSAWINVSNVNVDGIVAAKGDYNKPGWVIDISPNRRHGTLRITEIRHGQAQCHETLTPQGTLKNGQWHHIATVVSADAKGRTVVIYVDGRESARDTIPEGEIDNDEYDLSLGKFSGLLDEVHLIRKPLSANEIGKLMNVK